MQVDQSPLDTFPPYLRSVSVLQPSGDVVAEVLGAVAEISRRRRRRRLLQAGVGLALAGLLVLAWRWLPVVTEPPTTGEGGAAPAQGANALALESVTRSRTDRAVEGQPVYVVTAGLSNRDSRSITLVSLRAESQVPEYRFASSNDWYTLAPGETVATDFEGHWLGYYPGSEFRWRVCWTTIETALLMRNPELKGNAVRALLAEYGRQGCGRWMDWQVD